MHDHSNCCADGRSQDKQHEDQQQNDCAPRAGQAAAVQGQCIELGCLLLLVDGGIGTSRGWDALRVYNTVTNFFQFGVPGVYGFARLQGGAGLHRHTTKALVSGSMVVRHGLKNYFADRRNVTDNKGLRA